MNVKVHIMALTATASTELRKKVTVLLGMESPYHIVRSPDKENIRFAVRKVGTINVFFKYILNELQRLRTLLPRIIIFCKHKADCGKIFTFFRANMGNDFTHPSGTSHYLPEHRMVDMFFQGTEPVIKDAIIRNFTMPSF